MPAFGGHFFKIDRFFIYSVNKFYNGDTIRPIAEIRAFATLLSTKNLM